MRVALKAMREKRNLNQQQLAKKSGVKQPVICCIETGETKSPGIQILWRLAQALKCTVDDLIDEDAPDAERKKDA